MSRARGRRLACRSAGFLVIATAGMVVPFVRASGIRDTTPARFAIYYGYPSLVNGSNGNEEKAARVFSVYDAVVFGDGLEFPSRQLKPYPTGDPVEHGKTLKIMAATRSLNANIRFYGYVCLGEIASENGQKVSLSASELEERIRLWKQMGVAGIFLDEAGYDFAVVTRERQNMAVRIIHDMGLSAFMNAYFLEHLFSSDDKLPNANGSEKNPRRLPTLLDRRDIFLLESFQVMNGAYEAPAAWQARLKQALKYREQFGSRVFTTTTTTSQSAKSSLEMFNYVWWTNWLYETDGFSWGEPNFAASNNVLANLDCYWQAFAAQAAGPSPLESEGPYLWRKVADGYLVIVDIQNHSVRRVPIPKSGESAPLEDLVRASAASPLAVCAGIAK